MVDFIWGAWSLGIAPVPLTLWCAKSVSKPAETAVYHPDGEFISSLKSARGSGTLASNQSGEYCRGFDPQVLKDMGRITGGEYFAASSTAQLGAVYTKLGSNLGWTFKPSEVTHVVATAAGLLLLPAMVFGERNRRVI